MSSSVLDAPVIHEQATQLTRILPEVTQQNAAGLGFSETAIHALNRDDAMASGMIAVILSIAFLVLLGLVVSVSIWTIGVTA